MRFRRIFSPRARLKKRKQKKSPKLKVILISIFLAAAVVGLSFASKAKKLSIEKVNIEGNRVLTEDELREEIGNTLSGNYLFLFSKRNILIYPRKKIKGALLEKYKRIRNVNLKLRDLNLFVEILERKGEYLWCGNNLPVEEIPECFYVDSDGFIFAEAPYFSGNIFFEFYTESALGNFVLVPEEFERILFFKKTLADLEIETQAFASLSGDRYEFLLGEGDLGGAPKIIFSKDDDFERILNNLASALETEPLATKFREDFENLEYIDLRFGNKVVYKFSKN